MIKNIYSVQWKISGHTLFFRASASCSKILNVKSTFNTGKNFRGSASCQKILNVKSRLNSTQSKISGHTLFFRASANYSNILNIKSIFNTCNEKFQDNSLFQRKRKVAQKSLMVKNFNTVKNLGQTVFFKASASCSKILHGEKMFKTAYIHLGVIRVIWASVLCNLDQRRECL